MREIKFRAWDKKDKEMISWECFIGKDQFHLGTLRDLFEPDLIPMQYTGLKDKHGVEIYEGDIVKDGWLKDNPLEVVQWSGTGWEPFADHAITAGDPNTVEVIGNIYENPKLLK